ncbi:MAG: hypothetical protein KTR16_12915 [Acidiferrobacterales bacterium]|nr:hypothetical protein [Acidiferrobacterales bacterium]
MRRLAITIKTLVAISAIQNPVFAETQTMTRDAFIEAQIEQLKRAEQNQKELTKRNLALLKKSLPTEEFDKLMADEAATEQAAHKRMSACLGITESEFTKYRAMFDAEFQIELAKTCTHSLPDTITFNGQSWEQNQDLVAFQQCAQKQIAKRTKISQSRLVKCSEKIGSVDN